LAAAHEGKLIHRDIKPGNIWLEENSGRVKILDFGLAQAVDDPGHLTSSGVIAGTPSYMAPEQAAGAEVDPRCDLFSLGSVVYRMSTGELPFQGATLMQVLRALELEQPKPPREVNPELPAPLAALVMQLLAKDREHRPPSARHVAATLKQIEHQSAVPDEPPAPVASLAPRSGPTEPLRRRRLWHSRRRVALIGVLLLGALGLGRYWMDLTLYRVDTDRVHHAVEKGSVEKATASNIAGEVLCLKGHSGPVAAVTLSPDGRRVLSGSMDGTLQVWDAETGNELQTVKWHTGGVQCVAFSPNGEFLASGGSFDKTVALWDFVKDASATRIALQETIKKAPWRCLEVACFTDGPRSLWDGGNDDNVLHLLDTGREVQRFKGHTDRVWCAVFSPDGERILSGGRDRTARVWSVGTGKEVCQFKGHSAQVRAVAVSADGSRVLSGCDDGTVRLWDAKTGQELRSLEGHRGPVHALAFSPDGRCALSGGQDRILRLWNVDTADVLCRLEGHTEPIASVAFTPDGHRALSGGGDGTIRIWRLPP
jgi:WD40 repeat protein